MPEIKVWGEEEKREPEPVRLRLRLHGDRAELHAVNAEGERCYQGTLLYFSSTGEVGLIPSVNPEFDFTLDAEGRLTARKL